MYMYMYMYRYMYMYLGSAFLSLPADGMMEYGGMLACRLAPSPRFACYGTSLSSLRALAGACLVR